MDRETFYKMLAELEQTIAAYSCGCMGWNYTPERAKEEMEAKQNYLYNEVLHKYIVLE